MTTTIKHNSSHFHESGLYKLSSQKDRDQEQREIIDHNYDDRYSKLYSIPINFKWQIIPDPNLRNQCIHSNNHDGNNSSSISVLSDQVKRNQKAYLNGRKNRQAVPKELVSLCNEHIRRKSMMIKVSDPPSLSRSLSRSRSIDVNKKPSQTSTKPLSRHPIKVNSLPVILPPAIKIDYAADDTNDNHHHQQQPQPPPQSSSSSASHHFTRRHQKSFKPFRPRTTSELNILTQFKSTAPVKYSWYYKPC
ncbi:uncharacterized protein TRIADDRAFT_58274 [Trichoplax adhaerens]|uniref:Uncharacterized protein n=1 Tax=Trichoplax adhaerens TaxID=10228 RepID=B3S1C3_TRIAD|nr:predicted protein [Trichoplax adhaerens]EDV23218.1 predicted protein [Trichoplax adhaerens]|eukprot:XP_002114128.1 predicted protein [Trichoplax adhaerens]